MSFGPLSLEPRLVPAPAVPDEGLSAVPGWRLPGAGRGPIGLRPTSVSLALHALLVLLIILGIPEWLRRHEMVPPPAIEVALVVPEPPKPPPAPPPKPIVKPPEPAPPPDAPLSSDAQSAAPARPNPAENAEAAPAAPERGPQAAPARKPESRTPTPAAKPAAADPNRGPATPQPRSHVADAPPAPAASSPAHEPAPETKTAASAARPAPRASSEAPAEPDNGKAANTGYGVMVVDPPGGMHPAVFDAYLASVRDKIMTQRELLKTFQWSHSQVVIWMILDDKGRVPRFDVAQSTGSISFENSVKSMIARAPYFGPPPPGLQGRRLFFYIAIPDTQAEWDEMMATGKPPPGPG